MKSLFVDEGKGDDFGILPFGGKLDTPLVGIGGIFDAEDVFGCGGKFRLGL